MYAENISNKMTSKTVVTGVGKGEERIWYRGGGGGCNEQKNPLKGTPPLKNPANFLNQSKALNFVLKSHYLHDFHPSYMEV